MPACRLIVVKKVQVIKVKWKLTWPQAGDCGGWIGALSGSHLHSYTFIFSSGGIPQGGSLTTVFFGGTPRGGGLLPQFFSGGSPPFTS